MGSLDRDIRSSMVDAPFMLRTFRCNCPDGASEDGWAYSSKRNGYVFGWRRSVIVVRSITEYVRRTKYLRSI